MEVGVPVPSEHFRFPALDPSSSNDDIDIDIGARAFVELKALPAGPYLETMHVGAPSTLMDATRTFLQYAEREGLEFDVQKAVDEGSLTDRARGEDGKEEDAELKDRWAARLEWYEIDPAVVKDVREWRTRLSFKLR